jgi:hypothetical protein
MHVVAPERIRELHPNLIPVLHSLDRICSTTKHVLNKELF